jgi:hypothetical protein
LYSDAIYDAQSFDADFDADTNLNAYEDFDFVIVADIDAITMPKLLAYLTTPTSEPISNPTPKSTPTKTSTPTPAPN